MTSRYSVIRIVGNTFYWRSRAYPLSVASEEEKKVFRLFVDLWNELQSLSKNGLSTRGSCHSHRSVNQKMKQVNKMLEDKKKLFAETQDKLNVILEQDKFKAKAIGSS